MPWYEVKIQVQGWRNTFSAEGEDDAVEQAVERFADSYVIQSVDATLVDHTSLKEIRYYDHQYTDTIGCNVGDCDCPIIIKTFNSKDKMTSWLGSLPRAIYDDVMADDRKLTAKATEEAGA